MPVFLEVNLNFTEDSCSIYTSALPQNDLILLDIEPTFIANSKTFLFLQIVNSYVFDCVYINCGGTCCLLEDVLVLLCFFYLPLLSLIRSLYLQ